MQLTPEQLQKPLTGLTAEHAILGLQTISRLVMAGAIREAELMTIGLYRNALTSALKETTGIDYDVVLEAQAKAYQEQQRQAAAAQQAAPVEAEPKAKKTGRK